MPAEETLMEYYSSALSPEIAMFVKRSVKPSLLETYEEAKKVEEELESIHKQPVDLDVKTFNKNPLLLTNPKEERPNELDNVVKMVQKLSNKIVDLDKDKEASSSRKPFRQFFKKKEENSPPQPLPDNSSVLNLTEVGMENFCTFHQQPHSEKSCPQWINSMNLVVNKQLDVQLTKPKVKEEKETEKETTSEETNMVLLDCITPLGLEEEEPTEEIYLSTFNVTTRSQGPIKDESLLPKIKKFQESIKKLTNKTQNSPVPEKAITKKKNQAMSKPAKDVDSNLENNKKSTVELEMGYDVVEDIKKTKENISLFEMCNLP